MPRVVADSDEEEDDEFIGVVENNKQNNSDSGAGAIAQPSVDDGTKEKSTGSTERLERDLRMAELGLVTNSASTRMNPATESSMSPSMRATQRRHTTTLQPGSSGSAATSVKRSKTLKTYGAKQHSHIPDDEDFEHLKNDAAAPTTSQSAKFTEHSSVGSSALLPAGSIQEDFLNHEPNVMFRDSGSTVADDSSERQRGLALAIAKALGTKEAMKNSGESATKLVEYHSSPVAWSGSQRTDAAKSSGKQDQTTTEHTNVSDLHANEDRPEANAEGNTEANTEVDTAAGTQISQTVKEVTPFDHTNAPPNGPNSPVVEISVAAAANSAAKRQATPAGAQKSSKGRKRKADEGELLNSDEIAIGLPKEQYKPRLSRRRATHMVDEPVDFSVRPEKAAKVNRTKTANAASASTQVETSETSATKIKRTKIANAPSASTQIEITEGSTIVRDVVGPAKASSKDDKGGDPPKEARCSSVSPQDKPSATLVEQKDDNTIFMKPLKPTPKSRSASKRSQTTIFEDHVDFKGSQRSPSLRQQQAERKSALKDVTNEAPSKKRKTVVSDDEDDKDELANDGLDKGKDEQPPPKKRGRGRPSKTSAKVPAKSAEIIEDDAEGDEDTNKEHDVTKDNGQNTVPEATDLTIDSNRGEKQTLQAEASTQGSQPQNQETDTSVARPAPAKPAKQADKATPKDEETPKKKDAKKHGHSPIPRSSMTHRIGLSRNHRIPPLLRNMSSLKRPTGV